MADTKFETMRDKIPAHLINKLPKPTKQQTDEVKADFKKGIRCNLCGGWHHPKVVHLDYFGHAALTSMLLDIDPLWSWEPLALDAVGLPALDKDGGLWIKLTVSGVTRLGYGDAQGKTGGDAMKERIGDCLVSGTKITTRRGLVNIEDIIIGDIVPTSSGWEPVTDHWMSNDSAVVKRVEFENGTSITGTAHHKVPTVSGVKRIDELRNNDIMYFFNANLSCPDLESQKAQKILRGRAQSTGATRTAADYHIEPILCEQPHHGIICTGIYGGMSTSQKYLKDGTSIIRMATRLTMTRAIWKRCLHHLTLLSTGLIEQLSQLRALTVHARFKPLSLALAGAHPPVRRQIDGFAVSHMSSPKKATIRSHASAMNAQSNTHLGHDGVDFAHLRVKAVIDEIELQPVWNISVGDTNEYVANGILVKNSIRNSAMRFGAALELWHKGSFSSDDDKSDDAEKEEAKLPPITDKQLLAFCADKLDSDTGEIVKIGYKSMVQTGKKTATALIEWLSKKFTLTDELEAIIYGWTPIEGDTE